MWTLGANIVGERHVAIAKDIWVDLETKDFSNNYQDQRVKTSHVHFAFTLCVVYTDYNPQFDQPLWGSEGEMAMASMGWI